MLKQSHTNHAGENFAINFPYTACSSGDTVSKLVKKARTHRILIERKPLKRNRVLADENFIASIID
jgi:hypothetical protein